MKMMKMRIPNQIATNECLIHRIQAATTRWPAMNVPSPSRKAPVTAPFATKIRAKLGRSLHFGENINDEQLI